MLIITICKVINKAISEPENQGKIWLLFTDKGLPWDIDPAPKNLNPETLAPAPDYPSEQISVFNTHSCAFVLATWRFISQPATVHGTSDNIL
ncbi:MAG: hypothetical protein ACFNMD_05215 [Prevotella sp.]